MQNNIEKLIMQIEKLIEENKCNEAFSLCNSIISSDKNNAEAYYLRAKVINKNNFNSLIKNYTKCIELNPKNHKAYRDRGNAKMYLKDYRGAIDDFIKADDIKSLWQILFMVEGYPPTELIANYEIAQLAFTKMIEQDDTDFMTYIYRGYVFYALKDYYNAMCDFSKAIELNSSYWRSYFYRGRSRGMFEAEEHHGCLGCIGVDRLEVLKDIVQDFSKAIELNPNGADSYSYRASIYKTIREYDLALQDWNKYIELKPDDKRGYYCRAHLKCEYIEDYQGALDDFNKIISLFGEAPEAYYWRATAKQSLGNYPGALEDCAKVISLDKNYQSIYYRIGTIKEELEDYKGAIENFTMAISLDKDDYYSYTNRGYNKYKLGDYQGAIDDYTIAISLQKNDYHSYINRACNKGNLKDYQGAIDDLTIAINLRNNVPTPYFYRGILKCNINDFEGAKEDYNIGMQLANNKESEDSMHLKQKLAEI